MDDIKLEVPICNQYDKAHDESWAFRMCGPCSLWMLLKYYHPNFEYSPLELRDQLISRDGYLENIGFKHKALTDLANEYRVPLTFAKKFFYTPEEKEAGLEIIASNLKSGYLVIVSVFYQLNPAKGGHMVVINGLQEFGGQIIGFYIQDPDSSFKGHNYFLTHDEFTAGWRGGLIYQGERSLASE